MAQLKRVTCDPVCGFAVQSHDEKELVHIVQQHAKQAHRMNVTPRQIEAKMEPVRPSEELEIM